MLASLNPARLWRVTLVGVAAAAVGVALAVAGLGWWGFVIAAALSALCAGFVVDLRPPAEQPGPRSGSAPDAEGFDVDQYGRGFFAAVASRAARGDSEPSERPAGEFVSLWVWLGGIIEDEQSRPWRVAYPASPKDPALSPDIWLAVAAEDVVSVKPWPDPDDSLSSHGRAPGPVVLSLRWDTRVIQGHGKAPGSWTMLRGDVDVFMRAAADFVDSARE